MGKIRGEEGDNAIQTITVCTYTVWKRPRASFMGKTRIRKTTEIEAPSTDSILILAGSKSSLCLHTVRTSSEYFMILCMLGFSNELTALNSRVKEVALMTYYT